MIEGVRVGHWTDAVARTGCTVVLFPEGTVASGEVRGGAPATRDMDLLAPERLVQRIDAVVLSGGSAFGLAAAGGVIEWLEAQGVGLPTVAGPVPIVVGLSLFDLTQGDASVRPGPDDGRAACEAAADEWESGPVGAGTGATVGKAQGEPRPGGMGTAVATDGDLRVAAIVAVNAFGDVEPTPHDLPKARPPIGESTTIGVVVTNARLDKAGCLVVAQGGHDGMARALWPPHCTVDGDALVAAATGAVDAPLDAVRALAVLAVADAVAGGVPS